MVAVFAASPSDGFNASVESWSATAMPWGISPEALEESPPSISSVILSAPLSSGEVGDLEGKEGGFEAATGVTSSTFDFASQITLSVPGSVSPDIFRMMFNLEDNVNRQIQLLSIYLKIL